MAIRTRTASITTSAPAEVVFAILTDPTQHPRIDGSGTVKASRGSGQCLELGSTFGMDMKMGAAYKIGNTVVEFEQDRLIAWRHKGLHRWRYELTPTADGGTEITETWDLTRYGPAAVGFNLAMGTKTQAAIEATLAKLKAAAEADAAKA
ncbi:SRPBCC family protein [Nocardioides sp.]|uniref:SRPBCC family protein n=1 Tax=Nocardioides sp. TaxID=35761 RepID=UPI00286A6132|nr:SRPBCC family protein [Nocardioides sp.]